MFPFKLVLMIAALILFILGAIGVSDKINLVAAGLACWVLATMFG